MFPRSIEKPVSCNIFDFGDSEDDIDEDFNNSMSEIIENLLSENGKGTHYTMPENIFKLISNLCFFFFQYSGGFHTLLPSVGCTVGTWY